MMTALDYMNYQHDMQATADADRELSVWFQECEYWYLVLCIVIAEFPHLVHVSLEDVPF